MLLAETMPLPKWTEPSCTKTFHYSKRCLLGEAWQSSKYREAVLLCLMACTRELTARFRVDTQQIKQSPEYN